MHVFRLLGACSFAAILMAAAPARADDDAVLDTARELFQKGVKAYEQKKWDQCRAAFLAAFAIKRHQQIAGNLADCEFLVGAYRDAAEHAWFFLHALRPDAPAERRTAGESVLAESQRHIGTITLSADVDGAEVVVDGHAVGRTPLQAPLFVDPGRHTIEVLHGTRGTARETVDLAAGQAREMALTIGKKDGGGPPPPPLVPSERRPLWPALLTGGAAVVALAVGGGLTGAASTKRSGAETLRAKLGAASGACASPVLSGATMDCQVIQSDVASHDALNKAALGSFVAGGALALAGAGLGVWAATGPKDEKSTKPSVRVAPLAGRGAAGAVIVGVW